MKQAGTFTHKLWSTVKPIYQQIIDCNYIKRLTDGTLPHEWFADYLSQDVLYIIEDSRALSVTAARAKNPDEMYFFLKLAKDGLDIERELQADFMRQFNIPEVQKRSPAFKAYAEFLIDNAFNSPYPVAVAALLPCFWIYYKTGEYIFNNTVRNNPYRKWIDTYSGVEYKQYTHKFIQITEELGQKAESHIQDQMIRAFTEGTKHELRVLREATGK